jgi:hypothetical protein
MKTYDNGSFYTVRAGCDDVEILAETWPCSGFCYGDTVQAEFDKRNGDLVDLVLRGNGRVKDSERIDGAAMLALVNDMQRAGAARLGL